MEFCVGDLAIGHRHDHRWLGLLFFEFGKLFCKSIHFFDLMKVDMTLIEQPKPIDVRHVRILVRTECEPCSFPPSVAALLRSTSVGVLASIRRLYC